MQKKVYEDYEPISNIGMCSALLIVLGTATYLGVFSSSKDVSEKQISEPAKVIQKANQSTDVIKYQMDLKERSN